MGREQLVDNFEKVQPYKLQGNGLRI